MHAKKQETIQKKTHKTKQNKTDDCLKACAVWKNMKLSRYITENK